MGQKPLKIQELRKIARNRGGRCLSEIYPGHIKLPMLWECALGHTWKMSALMIRRGAWCSVCRSSYGEEIARKLLTLMLGSPVERTFPEWLRNPETGRKLQLDGYTGDEPIHYKGHNIKVAFEHQGQQHLKEQGYFNKTTERFIKLQNRDRLKRRLCKKRGVILVTIPEIGTILKKPDLPQYIVENLFVRHNLPIPDVIADDLTEQDIYLPNKIKQLKRCQQVAKSRGGRCLESEYINVVTKMRWVCAKGHEWLATTNSVVNRNSWCPECAIKKEGLRRRRYSIEYFKSVIEDMGGTLISQQYKHYDQRFDALCRNGHRWRPTPTQLVRRNRCRKCYDGFRASFDNKD